MFIILRRDSYFNLLLGKKNIFSLFPFFLVGRGGNILINLILSHDVKTKVNELLNKISKTLTLTYSAFNAALYM